VHLFWTSTMKRCLRACPTDLQLLDNALLGVDSFLRHDFEPCGNSNRHGLPEDVLWSLSLGPLPSAVPLQ